jgi:hypothetical protein
MEPAPGTFHPHQISPPPVAAVQSAPQRRHKNHHVPRQPRYTPKYKPTDQIKATANDWGLTRPNGQLEQRLFDTVGTIPLVPEEVERVKQVVLERKVSVTYKTFSFNTSFLIKEVLNHINENIVKKGKGSTKELFEQFYSAGSVNLSATGLSYAQRTFKELLKKHFSQEPDDAIEGRLKVLFTNLLVDFLKLNYAQSITDIDIQGLLLRMENIPPNFLYAVNQYYTDFVQSKIPPILDQESRKKALELLKKKIPDKDKNFDWLTLEHPQFEWHVVNNIGFEKVKVVPNTYGIVAFGTRGTLTVDFLTDYLREPVDRFPTMRIPIKALLGSAQANRVPHIVPEGKFVIQCVLDEVFGVYRPLMHKRDAYIASDYSFKKLLKTSVKGKVCVSKREGDYTTIDELYHAASNESQNPDNSVVKKILKKHPNYFGEFDKQQWLFFYHMLKDTDLLYDPCSAIAVTYNTCKILDGRLPPEQITKLIDKLKKYWAKVPAGEQEKSVIYAIGKLLCDHSTPLKTRMALINVCAFMFCQSNILGQTDYSKVVVYPRSNGTEALSEISLPGGKNPYTLQTSAAHINSDLSAVLTYLRSPLSEEQQRLIQRVIKGLFPHLPFPAAGQSQMAADLPFFKINYALFEKAATDCLNDANHTLRLFGRTLYLGFQSMSRGNPSPYPLLLNLFELTGDWEFENLKLNIQSLVGFNANDPVFESLKPMNVAHQDSATHAPVSVLMQALARLPKHAAVAYGLWQKKIVDSSSNNAFFKLDSTLALFKIFQSDQIGYALSVLGYAAESKIINVETQILWLNQIINLLTRRPEEIPIHMPRIELIARALGERTITLTERGQLYEALRLTPVHSRSYHFTQLVKSLAPVQKVTSVSPPPITAMMAAPMAFITRSTILASPPPAPASEGSSKSSSTPTDSTPAATLGSATPNVTPPTVIEVMRPLTPGGSSGSRRAKKAMEAVSQPFPNIGAAPADEKKVEPKPVTPPPEPPKESSIPGAYAQALKNGAAKTPQAAKPAAPKTTPTPAPKQPLKPEAKKEAPPAAAEPKPPAAKMETVQKTATVSKVIVVEDPKAYFKKKIAAVLELAKKDASQACFELTALIKSNPKESDLLPAVEAVVQSLLESSLFLTAHKFLKCAECQNLYQTHRTVYYALILKTAESLKTMLTPERFNEIQGIITDLTEFLMKLIDQNKGNELTSAQACSTIVLIDLAVFSAKQASKPLTPAFEKCIARIYPCLTALVQKNPLHACLLHRTMVHTGQRAALAPQAVVQLPSHLKALLSSQLPTDQLAVVADVMNQLEEEDQVKKQPEWIEVLKSIALKAATTNQQIKYLTQLIHLAKIDEEIMELLFKCLEQAFGKGNSVEGIWILALFPASHTIQMKPQWLAIYLQFLERLHITNQTDTLIDAIRKNPFPLTSENRTKLQSAINGYVDGCAAANDLSADQLIALMALLELYRNPHYKTWMRIATRALGSANGKAVEAVWRQLPSLTSPSSPFKSREAREELDALILRAASALKFCPADVLHKILEDDSSLRRFAELLPPEQRASLISSILELWINVLRQSKEDAAVECYRTIIEWGIRWNPLVCSALSPYEQIRSPLCLLESIAKRSDTVLFAQAIEEVRKLEETMGRIDNSSPLRAHYCDILTALINTCVRIKDEEYSRMKKLDFVQMCLKFKLEPAVLIKFLPLFNEWIPKPGGVASDPRVSERMVPMALAVVERFVSEPADVRINRSQMNCYPLISQACEVNLEPDAVDKCYAIAFNARSELVMAPQDRHRMCCGLVSRKLIPATQSENPSDWTAAIAFYEQHLDYLRTYPDNFKEVLNHFTKLLVSIAIFHKKFEYLEKSFTALNEKKAAVDQSRNGDQIKQFDAYYFNFLFSIIRANSEIIPLINTVSSEGVRLMADHHIEVMMKNLKLLIERQRPFSAEEMDVVVHWVAALLSREPRLPCLTGMEEPPTNFRSSSSYQQAIALLQVLRESSALAKHPKHALELYLHADLTVDFKHACWTKLSEPDRFEALRRVYSRMNRLLLECPQRHIAEQFMYIIKNTFLVILDDRFLTLMDLTFPSIANFDATQQFKLVCTYHELLTTLLNKSTVVAPLKISVHQAKLNYLLEYKFEDVHKLAEFFAIHNEIVKLSKAANATHDAKQIITVPFAAKIVSNQLEFLKRFYEEARKNEAKGMGRSLPVLVSEQIRDHFHVVLTSDGQPTQLLNTSKYVEWAEVYVDMLTTTMSARSTLCSEEHHIINKELCRTVYEILRFAPSGEPRTQCMVRWIKKLIELSTQGNRYHMLALELLESAKELSVGDGKRRVKNGEPQFILDLRSLIQKKSKEFKN